MRGREGKPLYIGLGQPSTIYDGDNNTGSLKK